MLALPNGTVTLIFTDVEGSTRLLQALGREKYARALEDHRELLRSAFGAFGGVEVEMQGDSFHFAFSYARDAIAAAAAGQRALAAHYWIDAPVRVRIGLHTGEPMQVGGLYTGIDVHRAARVMDAGHGGQVLLTERTADLVEGELPAGTEIRSRGRYMLKDFDGAQELFELIRLEDGTAFPPLRLQPVRLPARRRHAVLAVFAAVAVLAAFAGAAHFALGEDSLSVITPNSLVLLDPDTLEPIDVLTIGAAPSTVRATDGATWVLDAEDRTIIRVTAGSHETRTVSVGLNPTSLAVSPEDVWVSDGFTGTVARIDPETLQIEDTIEQRLGEGISAGPFGNLALVEDTLWVLNRDRTLTKIDTSTALVTQRTRISGPGPAPDGIAADRSGVWLGSFAYVLRANPRSGEVEAQIELTFDDLAEITLGHGALWVTTPGTDTLWQIDVVSNRVQRPIQIDGRPGALATGADALWVGTDRTGTLNRIDPASGSVIDTAEIAQPVRSIAVGPEGVWLTVG